MVVVIVGRGPEDLVRITPGGVSARNYAFDVTPARLVTGIVTERGIAPTLLDQELFLTDNANANGRDRSPSARGEA